MASHYVYDDESHATKSDANALPQGADPDQYVSAADWNGLTTDLSQTREAIIGWPTGKNAVQAATTTGITLSGEQTVDGVALTAGNRCLVKDQGTTSDNGIYVVATGAWTRATDADDDPEVVSGMTVDVVSGTVNSKTTWMLTTTGTIVVGTTGLVFSPMLGAKLSHGEVSQQGNAVATTISDTTSFFIVALSGTALSGLEYEFDSPANGRLRYKGVATKTFRVMALVAAYGGITIPTVLLWRLVKNGSTQIAKSEQPSVSRTVAVADHGAIQALVSLSTNDYVELAVRNPTAIQDVTVVYFNMQATEA